MNITVLDFMNYLALKGKPVTGLAMVALKNGWSGSTVIMSEETDRRILLYETIKVEKCRWRHQRRHKEG
jgi:hypothetical protein